MAFETDTPRNRGDKDAPHVSPVSPAEDLRTIAINRVAWGAVFAGVVIALITQLLLNMLGLGIGFATLDPAGSSPSLGNFSIGAGIWWVLSGIIAAFSGGWVAGRLAGKPRESTGGLHGLTAWAVASLIVIYLLTTALGNILGGAVGALGSAARGVGNVASAAAPNDVSGQQVAGAVESAVVDATGGVTLGTIVNGVTAGTPAEQAAAREQAAQEYAAANNVPIEQARAQVAQTTQQVRADASQAGNTATQAAQTATDAVATAALLSALALFLGGLAAWFGGRAGAVQPTVTGFAPPLIRVEEDR